MGQIWVLSRFQSQTIGNHYTPPNARYNAQIRLIGRIFCLPCLFGCGECPKPCHARIFWQGVNRPHLGADFHRLIGLIWIGQIDILGGYFVSWNYTVLYWLTRHFSIYTVFLCLSIWNAVISTAHALKTICFKSATYHLMYKYKKNPPKSPPFLTQKTPFFCLNFVLQKYCILHWFFMLIFRHTVTGFFDSLESVTQPSCNFLTP